MERPLILVIDDNLTTRKVVECHLSQAGYRVAMAPDAEKGLESARQLNPDLILLDHQLPGTTGDEVCRRLLQMPETASIPVVISSAMRNRAFARYTEFPNVIDQIPKPFTPELLKSGVASALKTGAQVVQAQRTGCAMPEHDGEVADATLEGSTAAFPLRSVLDFLNNSQANGRITVESGKARYRFAIAGGRVQAVTSATTGVEAMEPALPSTLSDLAPLLALTLGEQQDAQMSGLIRLLERSLSDPRRLRALLRFQAAVLTHAALTGEPGKFAYEPGLTMPPMFQAFPLQASLPALAVEGARHCEPAADPEAWGPAVFARQTPRGGNLDRAGMSPAEMKALALLDGSRDLAAVARETGLSLAELAGLARGLELVGLVERRSRRAEASVLVLEDDPEAIRTIQRALGPEGRGDQIKFVRDRVAAQLLLRRNAFDLVLMALDRPDQEQCYKACREQCPSTTRFIGIVEVDEEEELVRLDALGVDGLLRRPLTEADLSITVSHLLGAGQLASVS
jgi:CheY-like chemotaxis protein